MKKSVFFLAALVFLGSSLNLVLAQQTVTTVSPEHPSVNDEVTVTLTGECFEVLRWNNSFTREDTSIVCELRALIEGPPFQRPFRFSHDFGRLEAGEYSIITRFYWASAMMDTSEYWLEEEMITRFTVTSIPSAVISLADGWNLSSSWVEPIDADVPALMTGLTNAGILNLIKDGSGRFYSPRFEFNNIPGWDVRQGYMISVSSDAELEITGESIDADAPIPLESGWNTVAYFPEAEVEAPEAFRGIRETLVIAKDGIGRFYAPGNDFNNLPPLHRGQGYQVYTSEEAVLIWGTP